MLFVILAGVILQKIKVELSQGRYSAKKIYEFAHYVNKYGYYYHCQECIKDIEDKDRQLKFNF